MPPMTTSGRASPAAEAWRLIHQLITSQRGHFMAVAADFELSPPQIMALTMLEPGHAIPMSELATALGCDNSNVTGIVDRLEHRGLVTRRSGDHDRRLKMVDVSPQGADIRERLLARLYDEVPAALATLSEAEQRTLRDLLSRALEH